MGNHLRQNEMQAYERSETQRLLDQADDFAAHRRLKVIKDEDVITIRKPVQRNVEE